VDVLAAFVLVRVDVEQTESDAHVSFRGTPQQAGAAGQFRLYFPMKLTFSAPAISRSENCRPGANVPDRISRRSSSVA